MSEERADSGDFELMDREDEEQILAELRGVPVEKFIYKNSRGQFELSYQGTKWAVREMANRGEAIRVESHPKVDRCPMEPTEHIVVDVLARRVKIDRDARCETVLDTTVGSARGWIKQKLNDGRVIADEFFYNKTVSKAVRNAQQALMPQDFKKEMIETLISMQSGGRPPSRQGPPPKTQSAKPQGAPPQGAPGPQGAAPPRQEQRPAQQPAQRPPARPQNEAPGPQQAPASRPAQNRPQPPAQAPGQTQQPPQQRPANQTRSRPDQSPREAAADVLHQRFEVMLRQACGNPQDRGVMLRVLKDLTGVSQVSALTVDLMKELGPLLREVSKGAYKCENGRIHDELTGDVFWPKPEPQAEPPADPPPAAGQPVPDGGTPQDENFW